MKIKIKIFTFQLPRFLGGGKVIFEKFFSTKMKKKFSRNLLNKIEKIFCKFWFLLDKHFSEKQKSHRQGWRKNWFSKSGQGSCSKILFSLKKKQIFSTTRNQNFRDFSEKFSENFPGNKKNMGFPGNFTGISKMWALQKETAPFLPQYCNNP